MRQNFAHWWARSPAGHLLSTQERAGYNGLYYKHVTTVNCASSDVNKLKASLNDDARVVIYDRHMFIVQATGVGSMAASSQIVS
jgi:hypothetical protein